MDLVPIRPSRRWASQTVRLRLRWLSLLLWWGCVAWPVMAGPFVAGRVDTDSVLSDAAVRVVDEAFRRAGLVPPEYRALPLLRSLELANDGEIDADLMRIADIGQRYPNLVALRTPIARVDIAVYGHRDLSGCTRSDIAAMRLGIRRGLFTLAKHTAGLAVTDAPSSEVVLDMLAGGRFDAAVLVYVSSEEQARQRPGITRWPYLWASDPLYFWIHRKHAALAGPLDTALAAMQREGAIDRHLQDVMRARRILPLKPAPATQPASAPRC